MPKPALARIDVTGIQLTEAPSGQPVTLGQIGGVQVLVLLRHRH
jgi:hypothetical protein